MVSMSRGRVAEKEEKEEEEDDDDDDENGISNHI